MSKMCHNIIVINFECTAESKIITVISVEWTKPKPRATTFHIHTGYESCVCGSIQMVFQLQQTTQ